MNTFETVIIFKDDIETKSIIKKYQDILQGWSKTKKVKVDVIGKKALAYPIREIYTTGYYVVFTFITERENIAELERLLRIDDEVLKFITVKIDPTSDNAKELEDYIPEEKEESESEQEKPDALDVLLGFAEYKKKGVR